MNATTYNLWENAPGLCEETPKITYYPAEDKKFDATVVIFPGGAYGGRAPHEGKGYADFLNEFGYDAFVVDYRVNPHRFPLEVLDARRAVRFVRYNAEKFGINKDKVLVMGSSAGGSLATLASTCTMPFPEYEGLDEIDNEEFLPNGQILCYPVVTLTDLKYTHWGSVRNLLGIDNIEFAKEITPEIHVTSTTCPAFIWHTAEDGAVNVINSYKYATALKEANVPVEMHIFPYGNHGLGAAYDTPLVNQWTGLLKNWLEYMYK